MNFQSEIKSYVESNPSLVSMKPTSNPDLFVLKYKNKVFYDNLWNNYLENCRGTIVDKDFNIISRPLQKIYNYGIEPRAPRLSKTTSLLAYKKVNGFMAAVTYYNNDILVSTTGTIDSEYANMAYEMIDKDRMRSICKLWDGYTFVFECVHPSDPHIIPENPGLYLLAWRKNTWDSEVEYNQDTMKELANQMNVYHVPAKTVTLDALLIIVRTVLHEGFVAYTDTGVSFKIKSPYYLTKKLLARCNSLEKLKSSSIKQNIDEEFYPLVDYVQKNIDEFSDLCEQERLRWIRRFLENR